MKNKKKVILAAVLLLNIVVLSSFSQAQIKTSNDNEKWLKEKALLSKIIDGTEVKLNNEYSEWKTGTKYTRIPPEYGSSHANSYLSGKSRINKTAVIQIHLTNFAANHYHTGLNVLGRGSVTPLSSLGDEAVSIRDPYDPMGQVRFVKDNYYVVIYASRPKYAEEIASLVDKQIDEIENQVNETQK